MADLDGSAVLGSEKCLFYESCVIVNERRFLSLESFKEPDNSGKHYNSSFYGDLCMCLLLAHLWLES